MRVLPTLAPIPEEDLAHDHDDDLEHGAAPEPAEAADVVTYWSRACLIVGLVGGAQLLLFATAHVYLTVTDPL